MLDFEPVVFITDARNANAMIEVHLSVVGYDGECLRLDGLNGYAYGSDASLPVRRAVEQATVSVHAREVPRYVVLPKPCQPVPQADRVVVHAAGRGDLSASVAGEDEASVSFRCLVSPVRPCCTRIGLPVYRHAFREASRMWNPLTLTWGEPCPIVIAQSVGAITEPSAFRANGIFVGMENWMFSSSPAVATVAVLSAASA